MKLSNFYNEPVAAEVGSFVKPDGWNIGNTLVDEDFWDKANFRILTGQSIIESLACNVIVTGNTIQWPFGNYGKGFVRVRIEFPQDDEGQTVETTGGWMALK